MDHDQIIELRHRYDQLSKHSRLQAELLDVSGDCIKLIDPTGHLVYMNDAGCQALKVDPLSGFGQYWLHLLPEEVWPVGELALEQVRRGEAARFTGKSQLPGGPVEAWDNLLTPVMDDDQVLTSILCVSRNVSQALADREALRESQERLAMATHVGGLGIWDLDLLTEQMYCDDTWHAIMGRDPNHPVTSVAEFKPLIHPDDLLAATEVKQTAADLIATGNDYTNTFRIIRPSGEERWVRSAASLVQDLAGRPVRAIGFVTDITESLHGQQALQDANIALEKERALLEQQSLEDPLTALPNRRALDLELARAASRARRFRTPLAVAMMDLDLFKQYNDRYGHLAGDAVLTAFARCLRSVTRRIDFAGRFGGEEFVLILADTADAEPFLRRMVDLLAEAELRHEGSPHGRVTVSIGCAVFADGADLDPASMIKAADDALYEAKDLGRNQFVIRELPL